MSGGRRGGASGWAVQAIVVVALAGAVSGGADAADLEALQAWALHVVTLDVQTADGVVRRSSGVVATDDGVVAASWQAIAGAQQIFVRAHDGATAEVAGFVAARPELDLVLLAVRRADRPLRPAPFVARPLKIGETVHLIGGPGSAPLLAATDRLDGWESGRRYQASLPNSDPADAPPAVDPDQRRLICHAYLTAASVGGGMFADDGRLIGLLIPAADWTDRVHSAVYVGHVAELLEEAGPARPLPQLKASSRDTAPRRAPPTAELDAVDRPPRGEVPEHWPAIEPDDSAQGGSLRSGLAELRRRLAALPGERRRLQERAETWRKEARAPQQAFEQLQQQAAANRFRFAAIQPEMAVPIRTQMRSPGGGRPAVPTVTTERRFSPRQVAERARLDLELLNLNLQLAGAEAERLRHASRVFQTDYDLAAVARYQAALLRQAPWRSDPLELRSEADAADALRELDAEIDQGGAASPFLIARALLRTRLRRWDEALADLDVALEDDSSQAATVELLRARIALRRGAADGGDRLARAQRGVKQDPLGETILARCELDRGNPAAANRRLLAALDHGGRRSTLEIGLTWTALAAHPAARDARRALQHARRAVESSGGGDWHALASLGVAHAALDDWEAAETALARAETLADDVGLDFCRTWSDAVRRRRLPDDLLSAP